MKLLFLFMDGVGLGADDPRFNPLARAELPNLQALLEGRRLIAVDCPWSGPRASLFSLDATLGVAGLPQSATGQATLLTGQNIPAQIGYHYGPKPNAAVAGYLRNGNLFSMLEKQALKTGLINAYPPRYFETINSGYRLYSAIPLAAASAGLELKTADDLFAGRALAVDFTAQGWHDHLGLTDIPILDPVQAGENLARLAQTYDFAMFDYWPSDYAGHHQDMAEALHLLETFDRVLGGLLAAWNDQEGLILITSDHGNLEDLSTRRHTANPAPALIIGAPALRTAFAGEVASPRLHNLTDIAPAILGFVGPIE